MNFHSVNKKPLMFFILFLFSFLLSCSVKNESVDEKIITGIIYVTGNMPFSRLTLKADNDSTYYLKCDDSTKSFLYDNQGTKVEIKYKNSTDSAGIKILNVSEASLPAAKQE